MIELRGYQQDLIGQVRQLFRAKRRSVLAVLPTGGGKTVCFSHIAHAAAMRGNRVLINVHRRELLKQASNKLREFGVHHGLIIAGERVNPAFGVQVASIQTLARRFDRMYGWEPDLIITDEAHHAVAATWRTMLDTWPSARHLGVTATPCLTDGSGLGVECGGVFDDIAIGPQMSELIEIRALMKPEVFAPGDTQIDIEGVSQRGGDFATGALATRLDKPAITGSAERHYREHLAGAPAMVFCCNVAHAEHVAEQFRVAGWNAASVDGSMDTAERERRIAALGNGLHILTSCDLIGEGVDIPIVQGAFLLRSTMSLRLYLQQVGRILRMALGKERALIFDHVGNVFRHGMPDQHRDWSLMGIPKRPKAANDNTEVVRCQQCHQCFEAGPQKCPHCGHLLKPKIVAPPPLELSGTLRQVSAEDVEASRKYQYMQERARAKTRDDLIQFAIGKGYKNPAKYADSVLRARAAKDRQRDDDFARRYADYLR